MKMNDSTKYNPIEIEEKWYAHWLAKNYFRSEPDTRKPYTIVIPPPNVTGILHMGHMLNNTIQDVLIRRKRMEGFNACWVPGTDHASIATEAKVVQMLRTQGISKSQLNREAFLEKAWEWKEEYGGIILQQLRKLGASCDWERTHFTMDHDYYKSVIQVFLDLYKKGYVYRGKRMVNWDPQALTAVSDEEVIHKESNDKLYFINYKLEGQEGFVTIATTRPETIMADTAVSVNPKDERFKNLIGKKVIVPLVNRSVPIIADDYVDIEFGTGCLKVTPAHDPNDYEIGLRHNLEVIDIFNENATLNDQAIVFIGEDRFKARELVVNALGELNLLVKTQDLHHTVGTSERTGSIIEPRLSLQWYVKMKDISKEAYQEVMNDNVRLIPEKFKNTYRHWMENIKDWCISRQLWWGHRIPAWYTPDGKYVVAETRQEAFELFKLQVPDAQSWELALERGNISSTEFDAFIHKHLRIEDLKQDEDVLDTWFSSWLWPIEVFKGISSPNNKEINYYYPTNDLVTAPEILFFWVARMVMAGYQFKGNKPFNNVYLTGIVRDKLGRKMSKSLGNSPNPIDLIAQYGADGVRVGMLLCSPAGNDLPFDESLCEQGRKFSNKLFNAARLITIWEGQNIALRQTEKIGMEWMEARLNEVAIEVDDHFNKFRISDALMSIYKLAWDDFCSWYLEIMKPPVGEKISHEALEKTKEIFKKILQLAHPFTPFITEEIWNGLHNENPECDIIVSKMFIGNTELAQSPLLGNMEVIKESITQLRAFRAEKNISMKDPIEVFIKTTEKSLFEPHFPILKKFLNISNLEFGNDTLPGSGSTRVRTHEFMIPLGESVNVEEEKEKLNKEIAYTEGFLKTVSAKLNNEKFVGGAPEQVIENERKKKLDAEIKLKILRENLAGLN